MPPPQKGEPQPPPDPAPDNFSLELTERELSVLVHVLDEQAGRAARFPSMLHEMALIYLVALFDAYVADAFQAVLRARPEMMRSRRQLTYEAILEFPDRENLVAAMASREVNEVAYKSLAEQFRYYKERFGIDLDAANGVAADELVEIVARRNLLVHNAGVVNEAYCGLVPATSATVGERLAVDESYWDAASRNVSNAARTIDSSLRAKFLTGEAQSTAAQPPGDG